jgi:predicted alpha/beta-fold hydrolase
MTDEFVPPARLAGGHRMTLYAWGRPRRFPRLPAPLVRYFDVAPDARVLAHCYWQPRAWERPTILALHGLEGSSSAHYMRGIADKAFARGMNAVLLNQRNCGGTEALSSGLYHSGLTDDPAFVIRELTDVDRLGAISLVGYSLGGNLALKLAGGWGAAPPPNVHAVCAVSPTMDLARCVDALERRANRVYEWNFVRNLKRRMRRKARAFPGVYGLNGIRRVRTVRQFDEMFTAPHHGFRDASDYYHRASAMRVIDRIVVPTLILTAEDDPFVPIDAFHDPAVRGNRNVRVIVTRHGGHCGFVAEPSGQDDGYWAERMAVEFALRPASRRPSGLPQPY